MRATLRQKIKYKEKQNKVLISKRKKKVQKRETNKERNKEK
jgi:hypothetical protein